MFLALFRYVVMQYGRGKSSVMKMTLNLITVNNDFCELARNGKWRIGEIAHLEIANNKEQWEEFLQHKESL